MRPCLIACFKHSQATFHTRINKEAKHLVTSPSTLFFFPTCSLLFEWVWETFGWFRSFFFCGARAPMMPFTHNWRSTFRRSSITAALAENRLVGSESARPLPSRLGIRDSCWGTRSRPPKAARLDEPKLPWQLNNGTNKRRQAANCTKFTCAVKFEAWVAWSIGHKVYYSSCQIINRTKYNSMLETSQKEILVVAKQKYFLPLNCTIKF